jgi:hypothetical protein
MRKAADFRILPQARVDWERFVVPLSIEAVVDGLFALPPDRIKVMECPLRGPNRRIAHGRVAETLFVMVGMVNGDGEWERAETVAPVWPPDLGWEE